MRPERAGHAGLHNHADYKQTDIVYIRGEGEDMTTNAEHGEHTHTRQCAWWDINY